LVFLFIKKNHGAQILFGFPKYIKVKYLLFYFFTRQQITTSHFASSNRIWIKFMVVRSRSDRSNFNLKIYIKQNKKYI